MKKDFLSAVGYGVLMGILKNYEVVNPIVSATTDAFNRLRPGFEAPICIVTSLGRSYDVPTRNRTILLVSFVMLITRRQRVSKCGLPILLPTLIWLRRFLPVRP